MLLRFCPQPFRGQQAPLKNTLSGKVVIFVSVSGANDIYKDFILDKFAAIESVTAKRMFGGYVLHMAGRVLGFIFSEKFLFEPGKTIDELLPDAPREELFPGSKLFVVIDESISPQHLCSLARACYEDFPISKPRRRKTADSLKEQKEIEERFPFAKRFTHLR